MVNHLAQTSPREIHRPSGTLLLVCGLPICQLPSLIGLFEINHVISSFFCLLLMASLCSLTKEFYDTIILVLILCLLHPSLTSSSLPPTLSAALMEYNGGRSGKCGP